MLGRRRRGPWLVYGLCALLVIDVLAWATWRVLALERAERTASAKADTAQRERLALWQMDSLVSTLVARESARPYFEYRSEYASDLPYGRAWDVGSSASTTASTLAMGTGDPAVRLHYLIAPDGTIGSPQENPGPANTGMDPGDRADGLRAQRLVRELEAVVKSEPRRDASRPALDARVAGAAMGTDSNDAPVESIDDVPASDGSVAAQTIDAEAAAETVETEQPEVPDANLRQQLFDIARSGANVYTAPGDDPAEPPVLVGLFQPRWLVMDDGDPELVFEREVTVGDVAYRQGVWIDWPSLRAQLLAIVVRSIPDASLVPVLGRTDVARVPGTLATIPLRLIIPDAIGATGFWSPARVTLAVSWLAAVVALVAIGVVLRTAMRLAERRGRFVAAVTHELRSPLTSFRLHTDLLERAADDSARAAHVGVLRHEAARLGSVIENVLVYAGLRGARADRVRTEIGAALAPLIETFRISASEAGLAFRAEIGEDVAGAHVRARDGSIERILSNLVENACRYAGTAEHPEIVLSASLDGRTVRIRVMDNGPGVSAREREMIFTDFYRGTASAVVHSGIGLGLALGRGLARAEGGDLRCLEKAGPGASFELSLPVATG